MANYADTTLVTTSIIKQALGDEAVATVDLTDFASMGEKIINSASDDSKDIVFKTLIDRIGKTITDNDVYTSMFGYMFKEGFEYGCILQKIHVDNFTAKTSAVYTDLEDGDVDADLYKISLPTVHQTLFENEKAWEFMVTITDRQIKTAFTSAETLNAFINGIYIAMKSSIEKYLETSARAVVERLISAKLNAQAEVGNDKIHAVNLLQSYYDETGEVLTVDSCQYDADFLRWCTSTFLDFKNLFAEMTTLFNTAGYERFTRDNDLVFAIISKFGDNIKRYMTADVFNTEFVNTPSYKSVSYWQGLGVDASLSSRMSVKVKVKNPAYTEDGDEDEFITTDKKVVAIMHDIDALGITLKERDTVVVPNPHKHTRNLFEQGVIGNYVDTTENAVVFYLDTVNEG